MGYVILGDRLAVEFLYKNLENTNVSKCSKISELLCNKTNDSETLLANIYNFPKNITKAIIILGHDEHQQQNFHQEKFLDNLEKIVKKLKEFRVSNIIVGKVIPKFCKIEDLQYWTLVNTLNAKIHDLCITHKTQFINLDQVVLQFDQTKNYNQGQFYFSKDKTPRFRIILSRISEKGQLTDIAYQIMASKIEWLIKEMEKPKPKVNPTESHSNDVSKIDEVCESSALSEDRTNSNLKPTINTIEFDVEIPKEFRTKPIVSSLITDSGYKEVDDYKDRDEDKEVVSIKIQDYLYAPYVLFEINGHVLPALVDSGSPYTFINEDVFTLIAKNADPSEIRRVAAAQISVKGVLGKRPAKVIENAHTVIKFIDPGLQRISAWSVMRVIRGFNTPIILGREFLEVYSSKIGFGIRKGFTFLKPGTKEKVRLKIYNCNEIKRLVMEKTLEDPHNFLKSCKVSTIKPVPIISMIEPIEVLRHDGYFQSVENQRELLEKCPDVNEMNDFVQEVLERQYSKITDKISPDSPIPVGPYLHAHEEPYHPSPLPGFKSPVKRNTNHRQKFSVLDKKIYHTYTMAKEYLRRPIVMTCDSVPMTHQRDTRNEQRVMISGCHRKMVHSRVRIAHMPIFEFRIHLFTPPYSSHSHLFLKNIEKFAYCSSFFPVSPITPSYCVSNDIDFG